MRHALHERVRTRWSRALLPCLFLLATAHAELLDPLTAEERALAQSVAARDARVRDFAGRGRTLVVYVELAHAKLGSPRRDEDRRYAEVVQYRYEDDKGLRTLVDLQSREVRAVEEIDGNVVPLAREEFEMAARLALASDEVRGLLGRNARRFVPALPSAGRAPPYAIRPLLIQTDDDADPCHHHRCVRLFFQADDAYLTDSAIVDLTQNSVRIERGQR